MSSSVTFTITALVAISGLSACGGAPPPSLEENLPPRIIPGAVAPPSWKVTVNAGPKCRPTFSVSVEDRNLGDTLRSRWFIDPNNEHTTPPGSIAGDGNAVLGDAALVRSIEAPDMFTAALATITDGQPHRVEVWVTDGDFVEFAEPPPGGLRVQGKLVTRPDGTQVENPAYYDSQDWLVTVEAGCPP